MSVPENYDAAYMSNSKWQKLFRALIANGIEVERAEWWLSGEIQPFLHRFPAESDIGEAGFLDGKFPPVEYRLIEKVVIPHSFRPELQRDYTTQQVTSQIVYVLEGAGKFPIEVSADGLSIVANSRGRVYG